MQPLDFEWMHYRVIKSECQVNRYGGPRPAGAADTPPPCARSGARGAWGAWAYVAAFAAFATLASLASLTMRRTSASSFLES